MSTNRPEVPGTWYVHTNRPTRYLPGMLQRGTLIIVACIHSRPLYVGARVLLLYMDPYHNGRLFAAYYTFWNIHQPPPPARSDQAWYRVQQYCHREMTVFGPDSINSALLWSIISHHLSAFASLPCPDPPQSHAWQDAYYCQLPRGGGDFSKLMMFSQTTPGSTDHPFY